MKRSSYKIIIMAVAAFATAGCSLFDDVVPNGGKTRDLGDRVEIPFTVSMPQIQPTRALTDADEKIIDNMFVYVFRVEGSEERYAYTTRATNLSTSGSTVGFNVQLRKSANAEKYRLVFVANIASEFTIQDGATLSVSRSRASFTPASSWTSGVNYIPMTQESNATSTVTSATTAADFGENVALLRSLAKVDVVNNDSKFVLESVKLFNAPDRALVAPSRDNYDTATGKVSAPTLPRYTYDGGDYTLGALDPIEVAAVEGNVVNSFYIGEAARKAKVGDLNAVYIIVKGRYGGKASSYYRLDFTLGGTTIDILRNNHYQFSLTKVGGSGMPDEESAQGSHSITGCGATITVWNGGTVDPYRTTSFAYEVPSLPKEAGTAEIPYLTDYDGIPVVTCSADWISNVSVDHSNKRIVVSFSENATGAERSAELSVRLGNDTYEMKVIQAGI